MKTVKRPAKRKDSSLNWEATVALTKAIAALENNDYSKAEQCINDAQQLIAVADRLAGPE